ncbi:MAG: glycoside hydrolase family 3 C-terminal domain-containing protein, partial [Clostridiales bacterium]|nr:glycoside hydrolase family 3 C-terminal domain-containing protein [Clostridiales bacterium]
MLTKKRIIVSSVLYAVIAVVIALLIVATVITSMYVSLISVYFDQPVTKIVNAVDAQYYTSDFSSQKELRAVQDVFGQELQAEGSVLLKNQSNTLPLAAKAKVTLFGTRSVDFLYGGGGAGSIDTKGIASLKKAFEEAEFGVNPTVWDLYNTGAGKTYRGSASKVGEAPVSIFGTAEISSFSAYNDAAIVVIGRMGTESSDLSRTANGDGDSGRHMLELSKNEEDTIALAKANFSKVIVLLNTMNAFELGFLSDAGIGACLWVGAGGQKGILAVPKMLNGTMYPSGRLVDTFAYDALSAPVMQNFGNTSFASGGTGSGSLVFYAEGIYVGYKYYETRYEDVVLGTENVGTFDYQSEVQFPFGYGIAYTSFEYSSYALTTVGTNLEASVTVKNAGTKAGKEVVQIYMQSPYTAYDKTNGIEKASVQLVGFAKTKALAPGASETVKVVIPKELMRAYDANGAKTYIVDDGTYYFAAGKNAHDALNNILAAKGKTTANGMDYNGTAALAKTIVQAARDTTAYATADTGAAITNRLENVDLKYYESTVTYLSRSNWTGTYPTKVNVQRSAQMAADSTITEYYKDDPNAVMPLTNTVSEKYGEINLVELRGVAFDDERWDALLNRMTAEELYLLVRMGGYSTKVAESISKPATVDKDGSAGISSTLVGGVGCFGYPIETLVACTYNTEIAEQMGKYVGEDGLYSKTHGWYAPSMDIHRSPFSGRNFEYFSEDGFISGKFGAAMVKGVQSKGVFAYIKHFAFNDQETGRSNIYTFGNEQTMREIYLLPFEISIREGGALGLMDAMNRAGCYWAGAHKGLMTDILRNEWG